ncbi:hypothetical protein ABRY23_14055 [Melioribacteraceae bacterium 4301-Me]|uniref:hypothetical protein n=1 Tax=Pyranulibacter aquaticus TaxID=3163344 RepID=UPI003599C46B
MKTFKIILAVIFFIVFNAQMNFAWGKKTLKELVASAPIIVIGKVQDVNPKFEEYLGQKDFIFTYITLNIGTKLKGNLSQQTIIIKVPGGQIGDRVISGERSFRFTKNEEALLFLERTDKNYYEIYSISGKLPIVKNNNNKLIDCSLLKDDEVAKYNYGSSEKAEDIIGRINIYLSEKGGK